MIILNNTPLYVIRNIKTQKYLMRFPLVWGCKFSFDLASVFIVDSKEADSLLAKARRWHPRSHFEKMEVKLVSF